MATITETDPDRPAPAPGVAAEPAELPPIDPDAYEVLGEIARGGMGRIVRARDRRLDRIVAIKQLLVRTPRLAALFEREVRITARLQHPSIVSVYEAGILPGGELVYAMRLVPGRSLRDVLRAPRALPERLAFLPAVIAVADALAYAHQQRVVHRDLKPGNVLVGDFGEVVVIDWGLARELDVPDDAAGAAEGTPAYMSPEAARGEPADERADVYAIGAILYEALAGAPPYAGDSATAVRAAVRDRPPPPIEQRAPGVPADLAAIVAKAMARAPADRYPSARELAEELRRFQTGQLVSAHAYSVAERAARWVRRHRAPVGVAAVALVLGVVLAAVGVARIVRERDLAADRADRLTLAQARLERDRDPIAALRTLLTLPRRSPHWGAARVIAADAIAGGVATALPAGGDVVAVGFDGDQPRVVARGDVPVEIAFSAVAVSTDAATIAVVVDGELRVWRDGAEVLRVPASRATPRVAIAGDGSAVALAGRDLGVRAWTVADRVERAHDEAIRDVVAIAVSPGARTIAIARDGRVELLGAAARTIVTTGRVVGLALAGDGTLVAIADEDGIVRLDDGAGPPVLLRHDTPVRALGVAGDAAWIATGAGRLVRVWSRDGSLHHELRGHRAEVTAVAVSADGATVVSADPGGARRWDVAAAGAARLRGAGAAGLQLAGDDGWLAAVGADGAVWRWQPGADHGERLGAHSAAAATVAVDDGAVVSGGDDRTVRVWSRDGTTRVLGAHGGAVRAVAIARGHAASGGDDRLVRLWDLAGGGERVLGRHEAPVTALGFTGDGGRVVSIAAEPVAWSWSLAGEPPRRLELTGAATALAIGPGGVIAIGTRGGDVVSWQATGAAEVAARHDGAVRELAFSPDGTQIASAGDDGRVIVARAGAPARVLAGHDDLAVAVAFSPDGRTVASGGEDGTVRVWDVGSGEGRTLAAGAWVADVRFADGGDAVIATGGDGVVRRWRDDLPRDPAALRDALAAIVAAAP